jgi:hypothetical protein
MAGMLNDTDGLDNNCPSDPANGDAPLKVAAIVNWYGPTDVSDLIAGPDRRTHAVAWLGSLSDRSDRAKRVSPLTYGARGAATRTAQRGRIVRSARRPDQSPSPKRALPIHEVPFQASRRAAVQLQMRTDHWGNLGNDERQPESISGHLVTGV